MSDGKDKDNGKNKNKTPNIHEGHRDRIREKFISSCDFSNFAEHEILEMLLYSAICRKDTNPLAHNLIDRFGSFKNVFDASFADLCSVEGMTRNAAVLIKEIMPIARRYELAVATEKARFNSLKSVTERFGKFFAAQQSEVAYAILLNVNGDLLTTLNIGKGSAISTDIDTNKLVQAVRSSHAVRVILMHNHPSNSLYPSEADVITTNNTMVQLVFENVALWDHIIFGTDDSFFSFYQNNIIHLMVRRCNNFLRLDVHDLYDKLRIPESINKKGVKLNETQFSAITESMEMSLEPDSDTFARQIAERCKKEGIIQHVNRNDSETSYF